MKEAGRRCQRCDFAWYATPPGASPGKPRWFDEAGSFWTDGQARMARRTANYDRHLKVKDQWDQCPNCGSRSVKTDKSRGFRPTGTVAPTSVTQAPQVTVPPVAQPAQHLPQTTAPATPTGPSVWQRLGEFHGKHWRIIWTIVFVLAPFGSLGDDGVHTGNTALTALAVVGIFVGCWAVAAGFLFLAIRHWQATQRHRA